VSWRRFTYCIPWTTTIFFALTLAAQSLIVWFWFDQNLSPLQQYYFWAYLASSETAHHPGASTRIVWLMKAAPGKKCELALDQDVIAGKNGELPVQFSPYAIDQGWKGIEKSSAQRIISASLNESLREDFYGCTRMRFVILEPTLAACVLLIALIGALISSQQDVALEWCVVWREIMRLHAARKVRRRTAEGRGKAGLIRLLSDRLQQLKSAWKMQAKGNRFACATDGNNPPIAAAITGQKLPYSKNVRQFDSFSHPDENPTARRPAKKLTKRRSIFPGRAGVRGSAQASKPWDESPWID
jgi:hypothetical protein